jgi:hypothetical protein
VRLKYEEHTWRELRERDLDAMSILSAPGTNFVTFVCRGVNRGAAGVILAGCRPRA